MRGAPAAQPAAWVQELAGQRSNRRRQRRTMPQPLRHGKLPHHERVAKCAREQRAQFWLALDQVTGEPQHVHSIARRQRFVGLTDLWLTFEPHEDRVPVAVFTQPLGRPQRIIACRHDDGLQQRAESGLEGRLHALVCGPLDPLLALRQRACSLFALGDERLDSFTRGLERRALLGKARLGRRELELRLRHRIPPAGQRAIALADLALQAAKLGLRRAQARLGLNHIALGGTQRGLFAFLLLACGVYAAFQRLKSCGGTLRLLFRRG